MDALGSGLIVDYIIQSITSLLTKLQEPQRQAAGDFNIQGLIDVLLSSKSQWKISGHYLFLEQGRLPRYRQPAAEFQDLISQTRLLCEALRSQTSLDKHFRRDLERGHIEEILFQGEKVRATGTIVSEQVRVLGDLGKILEGMAKVDEKPTWEELEERKSFELEKKPVDISSSSSPPLPWKFGIRGFNWPFHSDAGCLRKSTVSASSPSTPPICNCRKCLLEAKKKSIEIDIQLGKDEEDAKKDRIILIIGMTQETNTITKLLMRLDKAPYTPEEVEEKRRLIKAKGFEKLLELLEAWDSGRIPPGKVDEKAVASLLAAVREEGTLILDHALAFEALWFDYLGRRAPLLIGNDLHLSDFFLHNTARIASPEYTPSETDILHLPADKLRMVEMNFPHSPPSMAEDHIRMRIINYHSSCGPSKRVWQFFADVTSALIIPINLTCYIQDLDDPSENYHHNILQDDIFAFVNCYIRSRMVSGASIFLWLGNVKMFKEMVGKEDGRLDRYMKDCDVGNDGEKAVEWVVENLLKEQRGRIGKDIFIFYLDVLDVKHARKVVGEMGDTLLVKRAGIKVASPPKSV